MESPFIFHPMLNLKIEGEVAVDLDRDEDIFIHNKRTLFGGLFEVAKQRPLHRFAG